MARRRTPMKRSEDRILTTHVGSLPRPQEMLELGNMTTGRPKDLVKYREVMARGIADMVKKQAEAGLDIVNDGEFGKSNWANYILERITGFEYRRGETAE